MKRHVVHLRTQRSVVVERGIDPAGRWAAPDPEWPTFDTGDGIAVPGMVDAHAHLTSRDVDDMHEDRSTGVGGRIARHSAHQLEAGVLLVIDKGTHLPSTVAQTLALPEGQRPYVQLAGGFLASPGGYYPGIGMELEPGDLATAVADATPQEAEWVKFIGDWPRKGIGAVPNFDEKTLSGAVEQAHRDGRRTAVHAAAPETPSIAVRAGVDSIEHGLFLTEDDLAMLGARGGAWVPTVAAMERVAAALREGSSGRLLFEEGFENVRRLLRHAPAAGVTVMVGTDLALAHGDIAVEAQRLCDYGLPEAEVLRAITTGPRDYLGLDGFQLGKSADFIMLEEMSVGALAAPRLVVRCGVVVVDRRR